MPINSYGGLPGSGKTYEMVSEVIIPQLANGRRVVTNVEGLKIDLIQEYIEKKFKKPIYQQGQLVIVTDDQVKKSNFFCGDDVKRNQNTITQYGDMIIIDEAWRYWGPSTQIKPEDMEFFTKHRHYSNPETGVTCDLCLVNQDPATQLHRQLKSLIENTFIMRKHKALGLSTAYRVDVFSGSEGIKTKPEKRTIDYQKTYKKEIYALYASYSGGTGTEKQIDRRQNVFAKKSLWYLGGIGLIIFGFSLYKSVSFFMVKQPKKEQQAQAQSKQQTPLGQLPNSQQQPQQPQMPVANNPFSSVYKITGIMELSSRRYAIIDDGTNRAIPINLNSYCTGRGIDMVCKWNNQTITYNSGVQVQTQTQSQKN